MLRIALIYGSISGIIVISVMTAGIVFSDGKGAGASQAFGYLIMLIALSMIFIGVKRHRDTNLGGIIKFAPAFGMGIAIAAVAGVFYVAGWEAYLASTDYAFASQYAEGIIEAKRQAGVTGETLEKAIEDMDKMVTNYANPLYRLPITFSEIFPIGLLIALISALILRNPKAFPAR
ncbi:DUF4199 domain-containing protein [Hyphococcus flavus]|uniref:DUF4199 domain-containing protein n=1 Tax=Hyphococcus flavus TaxID=1866326 RepID=A0AAE9ZD31_9PROT|nr:DUF4199 domain-containing protein [Hyphococcus flavus]WDI32768.1 DUF4199 domain-containing protein [Hyphococcus flavus]